MGFLLLLKAFNTNPLGIVVIYMKEGYSANLGSAINTWDTWFWVALLGDALTSRLMGGEELYKLISAKGSDVSSGNIYKAKSALRPSDTPGLYVYSPYKGSMD
jgi:hypothetical protein